MPVTNAFEAAVKAQIRQFVIESFLFGQGAESLGDDDSFLDSGIIDSTGVLELVGFIETNFHVPVGNHELLPDNLDSINRVAGFVWAKLSTREVSRPS
jgi:acyl carrier protein